MDFKYLFQYLQVPPFYQNIGGSYFGHRNIVIYTFEKIHGILNILVREKFIKIIKLMFMDEIHMNSDEGKEPAVESLVTKILLLKDTVGIIFVSSIFSRNDNSRVAQWIKGFPFVEEDYGINVEISILNSIG
jgi:replicative superfamily II helicase